MNTTNDQRRIGWLVIHGNYAGLLEEPVELLNAWLSYHLGLPCTHGSSGFAIDHIKRVATWCHAHVEHFKELDDFGTWDQHPYLLSEFLSTVLFKELGVELTLEAAPKTIRRLRRLAFSLRRGKVTNRAILGSMDFGHQTSKPEETQ